VADGRLPAFFDDDAVAGLLDHGALAAVLGALAAVLLDVVHVAVGAGALHGTVTCGRGSLGLLRLGRRRRALRLNGVRFRLLRRWRRGRLLGLAFRLRLLLWLLGLARLRLLLAALLLRRLCGRLGGCGGIRRLFARRPDVTAVAAPFLADRCRRRSLPRLYRLVGRLLTLLRRRALLLDFSGDVRCGRGWSMLAVALAALPGLALLVIVPRDCFLRGGLLLGLCNEHGTADALGMHRKARKWQKR
jgi:hypothetical protein